MGHKLLQIEEENAQTGASGNWIAEASKWIKSKIMLVHNFPLVELIFSHGKNAVVVCPYLVKCSMLKISPLKCKYGFEDIMR